MSELWPCGHPRTEENTRKCGVAGVRCKECRREIDKKYWAENSHWIKEKRAAKRAMFK